MNRRAEMSASLLAEHSLAGQKTQVDNNIWMGLASPPSRWPAEDKVSAADLEILNHYLEQCSPLEIIRWAVDTFGDDVVMSSSFQHHSTALLHMVAHNCPELLIFFIDTGLHFPETLAFKEQMTRLLSLRVVNVRPAPGTKDLLASLGPDLPRQYPDLCCRLNKILPLQQALRSRRAWITGRRRDQSPTRGDLPVLEVRSDGLVKINPLATWTGDEVKRYVASQYLPSHPLFELGYRSIGCAPCTRPVCADECERAGRWPGCEKLECGLHTSGR